MHFSTMADESTTGVITAATVSTGSTNEDTDDQEPVASVVTANEFLELGLNKFFDGDQLRNVKKKDNLDRFVAQYGCLPRVCAMLWEDLQRTRVPRARLKRSKTISDHFLMTLHH